MLTKQNGNPQETPLASMGLNSAPQHMRHNDPALCDSGILLWMRLTGNVPGTHIHREGEGRLLERRGSTSHGLLVTYPAWPCKT